MKKTEVINSCYCDFCGEKVEDKKNMNVPIPCVRSFEQEEGRHRIQPFTDIAYLDLCEEHYKSLVLCTIAGAQGCDIVSIKGANDKTESGYYQKKSEFEVLKSGS